MSPQLELKYRRTRSLKPYERNAKLHPPEQVATLRRIIDEFGFNMPIALRGNETDIGAGHGRWQAALLEPVIEEIPTVVVEGLSPEQWRAWMIADNKIQERGGWNLDLLKDELRTLKLGGFDLSLTGFEKMDLKALLSGRKQRQADPEKVPPKPRKPVSRLGDIWVLGDHRLLCGDSTSAEAVAQVLAGAAAALCCTDPPYGIGYAYNSHDDSDSDANAQLVAAVFAHAPAAKVWTPGLMNVGRDINRFGHARQLCWHKGFAAAGNGLGGASTWEPVLVIEPPRKKLPNDYLDFPTDREELGGKSLREYHPCPKPVALFAHLLDAFSEPGAVIYEPFSGSGTTLIACEIGGRRCHAIELDPAYVDVAVMRWQEFTGLEAVLEGGADFATVAAERAKSSAGPSRARRSPRP